LTKYMSIKIWQVILKAQAKHSSKVVLAVVACATFLVMACNPKRSSEWVFESDARPLVVSPSQAPQLETLPSGVVLATLVEPAATGGQDLFFCTSATGGDIFAQSQKLNSDAGSVHPHREGTPRLLIGGPGNYYALWTGAGTEADRMELYFSRSHDYGHSFSPPSPLGGHEGGSHPYFNAAVAPNGTIIVTWIAYDTVKGAIPGTGVLQIIRSADGGTSFSPPLQAEIDVCPCCRPELQTDGKANWYLAWRHVDPDEERDIMLAASRDDGRNWLKATRVSHDGWHIDGCPDSGPSLALLDGEIFVAWHTVVNEQQRLFWSLSKDGGRHFEPRRDLGGDVRDPNHPYLATVGHHILAAFQGRDPNESQGWGDQRIYVRQIEPEFATQPTELAHGSGSASYPVIIALSPNEVMTAWTNSSENSVHALSVRGYLRETP
jgi:hypothetical protein